MLVVSKLSAILQDFPVKDHPTELKYYNSITKLSVRNTKHYDIKVLSMISIDICQSADSKATKIKRRAITTTGGNQSRILNYPKEKKGGNPGHTVQIL